MFYVLLVSHGGFASALLKAAEMIVGKQDEGVLALGMAAEDSPESIKDQTHQFVSASAADGGTLILTDILSGSPFLASVQVFRELRQGVAMEIITGANLPMLIEVLNARRYSTLEEAKRIAMSEGRVGIRDFSGELQSASGQ